jgi:NhaP-type Na+/H+ or K+/H+ antiporter
MSIAFDTPALTVALALAAGMLAQIIARHVGLPGIVILLAVGAALGPDAANVVQPETLGRALLTLVDFAVAVILFEGAMNLNLRRISREARSIRSLVTLGALISLIGGALSAHYLLGWPWQNALLFGSLVIVTGPTVVTPLIRRMRLTPSVATVLEAEGVFGDAIGAIVAIVMLEFVIGPPSMTFLRGLTHVVTRLGFGAVFGLVGGAVIALFLRFQKLVPDGLENVLTLSLVLALFQTSKALFPESGIAAVIVAGMVVGNTRFGVWRELQAFKEQLTVMLIGLLFVLLAADVRLSQVRALGWLGLVTVLVLMLVVRPLGVALSTWGSELDLKHRAFIAWMGPRGIVAAAVASYFDSELSRHHIAGGPELRAMVFVVIAVTVVTAGVSGGLMARALGLSRPRDVGWVILGTKPLGRALAESLRDAGEDVVCIDANPDFCRQAEKRGLRVVYGNGLEESTLEQAEVEARAGVIGLTSNDEVNVLFAQKARRMSRNVKLFVALENLERGVTSQMVHEMSASVLFGSAVDVEAWNHRFERRAVRIGLWRCRDQQAADGSEPLGTDGSSALRTLVLPLTVSRAGRVLPVDDEVVFHEGDEVTFAVNTERAQEADDWLSARGWIRLRSNQAPHLVELPEAR